MAMAAPKYASISASDSPKNPSTTRRTASGSVSDSTAVTVSAAIAAIRSARYGSTNRSNPRRDDSDLDLPRSAAASLPRAMDPSPAFPIRKSPYQSAPYGDKADGRSRIDEACGVGAGDGNRTRIFSLEG